MVLLRPGDRVLIALTEDVGPEETQYFTSQLRRSFPRVTFTVVGGVAGIAVQGGDHGG
jgi:hypothetical protein